MAVIDGFTVQTGVLISTAADVRKVNDVLDGKLADINKSMNDLENSWQSDAATEIRSNMNAMRPRFEQYKNVVESYCKFLDETARLYGEGEDAIERNASQFKQ